MSNKADYNVLFVYADDLKCAVGLLNSRQDKIVAVTQRENSYTIFYEMGGNK